VVFLRVSILLDGSESIGRIVNIAEEGAFVQTRTVAENGTPAALRIQLDGVIIEARGTVVWASDVGFGLRFPDPTEPFREFVRRLAASDDEEKRSVLGEIDIAAVRLDTEEE